MTNYPLCKRGHIRLPDNLYKNGTCKLCMKDRKEDADSKKLRSKRYREENREKCVIAFKKSVAKNREHYLEKSRKWRIDNPEKTKLQEKQWNERNPGYKLARTRKRQASQIQRTPSWLTKEQIEEMNLTYQIARIISEQTGTQYHVDHIVPLQGKTVSGLHVPWNLRVITWHENIKKT